MLQPPRAEDPVTRAWASNFNGEHYDIVQHDDKTSRTNDAPRGEIQFVGKDTHVKRVNGFTGICVKGTLSPS